MDVQFIKMDGLGNDFVVIDNRKGSFSTCSEFVKSISDRRTGVGCDQTIVLGDSKTADVFMHIYNQDGSVSGACGNATRCVAYLIMQELNTDSCVVQTTSGLLRCNVVDGLVQVNMGFEKTDWNDIPLSQKMNSSSVDVGLNIGTGYCVNMGNPHIVFLCDDVEKISLSELGAKIENHKLFPERTNVEFISPISNGVIRMRVWERGGMITNACGSGACASFVASNHYGIGGKSVEVIMDGGSLFMRYADSGEILMRGAVSHNFTGVYTYEK